MTEARQVWEAIQPTAAAQLGPHIADHWLIRITPIEIANDIFIFETDLKINREWINERYADDILRLLRTQLPSLNRIEIKVRKPKEGKAALRQPPPSEQQLDLFVPILTDVSPRDARDAMELPFLSLSKSKRVKPIIYGDPENPTIQVYAPEKTGIANIYDWDIIIYCAAHIRAALNAGEPISPKVRIVPAEYLKATRRYNNSTYQNGLTEGIRRLNATTVETTIRGEDQKGGYKAEKGFHWINSYEVKTRINNTAKGQKEVVEYYEVELCKWLYNAILNTKLVLTLDKGYFLLDGGYERWLYRLVRKSAGKGQWTWTLSQLYERSGQGEPFNKFAYRMRNIVAEAQKAPLFPGYHLTMATLKAKGKNPEAAITAKFVGKAKDAPEEEGTTDQEPSTTDREFEHNRSGI